MDEKTKVPAPAEEPAAALSAEEAAPQQRKPRASRNQQRRNRNSVFQYIAILFAAAFVLLLFTFVMERRQHELLQAENQEQIEDLQQSVTAVQSLQNLYDENARLKDQVAELEEQLQQSTLEGQSEKTSLLLQIEANEKGLQAMDWFWQIDEAYVRGRYSLCRSLIQNLEGAGLASYLPKESITDNERVSPYDRYLEIKDRLD